MAAIKATSFRLIVAALLVTAAAAADTYTNYTVGGDAGWFFDSTTNKTSADYAAWAANTTFNLGDYLSKYSLLISKFNLDSLYFLFYYYSMLNLIFFM